MKKTKFLRTFEKILNRVCKEYDLDYRTDTAKHGNQYFIRRAGYPEKCVQIATTPRNRRHAGDQVRKDLLEVLTFLDIKNPEVAVINYLKIASSKKTVWEEIDEFAALYNGETQENK